MEKIYNMWLIVFIFNMISVNCVVGQHYKDTVSFIHLSDIHFVDLTGYDSLITTTRYHYGNVFSSLHNFLQNEPEEINADFLTITGDMIDFYSATSEDGNKLKSTQIEQFSQFISFFNKRILMSLGNHDIHTNIVENEGKSYTESQINAEQARATWVREFDCFKNGTYYSRSIKIGDTNYKLVFLDNGYYNPIRSKAGEPTFILDQYQLNWFEDLLKNNKDSKFILFMHIPILRSNKGDIEQYRNTYHLDLKDNIPREYHLNPELIKENNLYSIIDRYNTIQLIVCGHQHASALNKVLFPSGNSVYQVMTGSFARDARNWRLINITENEIIFNYAGVIGEQYKIKIY